MSNNACGLSELITEDDLPICSEFADNTWDGEFMAELGPQSEQICRHAPENIDPPLTHLPR